MSDNPTLQLSPH